MYMQSIQDTAQRSISNQPYDLIQIIRDGYKNATAKKRQLLNSQYEVSMCHVDVFLSRVTFSKEGKMQTTTTKVKDLVLDAGPLLSLTPLRGLAERFLTVPQVLDELKDKRAREHFERLALTAGVQIEIRNPDAAALVKG